MSVSFNVKSNNTDAIKDQLKRQVALALDAVGQTAVSKVKELTPVGTPESTGKKGYVGGRLRNSITHLVDDNKVTIGTNVEYAIYVEMRDKAHHDTGQAHFLRDGINNNMNQYREIIRNTLKG